MISVLAAMAEGIGHSAVRDRGVIGGSNSNNDPAANYPAPRGEAGYRRRGRCRVQGRQFHGRRH